MKLAQGEAGGGTLGRLVYINPEPASAGDTEPCAAPTGLIISNECAPSVPLRSTLGYPESAPPPPHYAQKRRVMGAPDTALGFRQLACQTESHIVGCKARNGNPALGTNSTRGHREVTEVKEACREWELITKRELGEEMTAKPGFRCDFGTDLAVCWKSRKSRSLAG